MVVTAGTVNCLPAVPKAPDLVAPILLLLGESTESGAVVTMVILALAPLVVIFSSLSFPATSSSLKLTLLIGFPSALLGDNDAVEVGDEFAVADVVVLLTPVITGMGGGGC